MTFRVRIFSLMLLVAVIAIVVTALLVSALTMTAFEPHQIVPALAGLVLASLAASAVIARQVGKPVWRLTVAAFLLATGDRTIRVPATGRGELNMLALSFNVLADALERSEERQRRLLADVAHEMRTPLANLQGYLEALCDGIVQPSPELFASLHEEAVLQSRILDDLQTLTQAESGDLSYTRVPFDLAELAASAVLAQRAVAAERGVVLTADTLGAAPVVSDPDRLRQVLGNLLGNAVRYTDRGGRVTVRVRVAGDATVLTVRDTGIGMTPAELEQAFDRFWRADPARQRATGGAGLGLTIARRIVLDLGGRIEAASEPGRGTTFSIRLPGAIR